MWKQNGESTTGTQILRDRRPGGRLGGYFVSGVASVFVTGAGASVLAESPLIASLKPRRPSPNPLPNSGSLRGPKSKSAMTRMIIRCVGWNNWSSIMDFFRAARIYGASRRISSGSLLSHSPALRTAHRRILRCSGLNSPAPSPNAQRSSGRTMEDSRSPQG